MLILSQFRAVACGGGGGGAIAPPQRNPQATALQFEYIGCKNDQKYYDIYINTLKLQLHNLCKILSCTY